MNIYDTLQTINGCDSIVTMDFTINYSNIGFDTLIGYNSLSWNGNNYDTSGTYVDTLSNITGCDSVVTLDLTIYYTQYNIDSLTACDSAIWNGNIYTY